MTTVTPSRVEVAVPVAFSGWGAALPTRVVSNAELARTLRWGAQ